MKKMDRESNTTDYLIYAVVFFGFWGLAIWGALHLLTK